MYIYVHSQIHELNAVCTISTLLQGLLDYEVDSDDEWEEEEPGESLSNSEVSKADLHRVFSTPRPQCAFHASFPLRWSSK